MGEFTWDPRDAMVRCPCGERYADAPGVVRPCAMCGDEGCGACQTQCPECKRYVCAAHIIEKVPVTKNYTPDLCTDCARLELEVAAAMREMFPTPDATGFPGRAA